MTEGDDAVAVLVDFPLNVFQKFVRDVFGVVVVFDGGVVVSSIMEYGSPPTEGPDVTLPTIQLNIGYDTIRLGV